MVYQLFDDHMIIKISGESIKIKLPPSEDLKGAVNCSSPSDEDLDGFLGYFFEGTIPDKFNSRFAKIRLCNQLIVFYDMTLEFGEFERPSGDLECVWFGKKFEGLF